MSKPTFMVQYVSCRVQDAQSRGLERYLLTIKHGDHIDFLNNMIIL